MDVRVTLKPGQKGTDDSRRDTATPGLVPYRYDKVKRKRYKTLS